MTPKEKALQLHTNFKYVIGLYTNTFYNEAVKQCVKECIKEILENLEDTKEYVDDNMLFLWNNKIIKFWEDVLEELEKL